MTTATAVEGRTDREPRIIDIHAHFPFSQWFLGHDQAKRHTPAWFWNPFRSEIDLPRAVDAGVDAIFSVVFVPRVSFAQKSYMETARRMLLKMEGFLQTHRDRIAKAGTAAELERIVASGRTAVVHVVEGGHCIEEDLDSIDMFHAMGVRYITLTHDLNNNIASAATHPRRLRFWDGLSAFGRRVVRRMNDLRMIVDLSHISERGFWEVMRITQAPVLCSHIGTRHHSPCERNLSDEQIRAVARNGGLIGIIVWPWLLRPRGVVVGFEAYLDNIEYVARLVGPEFVCLGTDLDGFIWNVRGIRDVTALPRVAEGLRGRGFDAAEVHAIMAGNALNFFRRVVG